MAEQDVFLDDISPAEVWRKVDKDIGLDAAERVAMEGLSDVARGQASLVPINSEHPNILVIKPEIVET